MSSLSTVCFFGLLLCLLGGCENSTNAAQDYVHRLENILEVTGEAEKIKLPMFPKPRDLQINFPSSELSIKEFLSLRECKLHTI